jgi:hypothetical protein
MEADRLQPYEEDAPSHDCLLMECNVKLPEDCGGVERKSHFSSIFTRRFRRISVSLEPEAASRTGSAAMAIGIVFQEERPAGRTVFPPPDDWLCSSFPETLSKKVMDGKWSAAPKRKGLAFFPAGRYE